MAPLGWYQSVCSRPAISRYNCCKVCLSWPSDRIESLRWPLASVLFLRGFVFPGNHCYWSFHRLLHHHIPTSTKNHCSCLWYTGRCLPTFMIDVYLCKGQPWVLVVPQVGVWHLSWKVKTAHYLWLWRTLALNSTVPPAKCTRPVYARLVPPILLQLHPVSASE